MSGCNQCNEKDARLNAMRDTVTLAADRNTELEAEKAQQAAIIAAIEKWAIRNKCFVSVEAFRENMQHRAALTKGEL